MSVVDVVGAIASVIHPVTKRRDGGLETQAIGIHSAEESCRGFAAPSKLSCFNFQVRHARGQVSLDHPRIHFLLGDRISNDHQSIALGQQQRSDFRSLGREELAELWIVRFGLVLVRAGLREFGQRAVFG